MDIIITNNPFESGKKLKTGYDYFAKGFNRTELVEAFYRLIADKRQGQLLLESADFCDIDAEYNPGDELGLDDDRLTTEESMVLESVRVRAFSQTAKTMAALQRVLNKHLGSNDKGITAGEAIIGKPKKTGLFASVTVQFPLSDGQTLSIIFHSPDNNKMKILATDEILAFRWLLNKRDITVAVAPDDENEVSLETVGTRCAQLIVKNSDRFQAKSAELVSAKKDMEDLKAQSGSLQDTNGQLQQDLAVKIYEGEKTDAKISAVQKQLDKQTAYNEELRAKLDGLKAAGAGNSGKASGEDTTSGVDKTAADVAAFEEKKAAFESELVGRGFSKAVGKNIFSNTSGLAAILHVNKDVSFTKRPNGFEYTVDLADPSVPEDKRKIGGDKSFACADISGVDGIAKKALDWVDKKMAEIGNDKAEKDQFITLSGSDDVVAMTRADFEAGVKRFGITASSSGPENSYAPAVRNRLEDVGLKTPQEAMSKFLELKSKAVDDAISYLRIGLAYVLDDLKKAGFDSPDISEIRNNVVNKYELVDGIIKKIAEADPAAIPAPEVVEPDAQAPSPEVDPAPEVTNPDTEGVSNSTTDSSPEVSGALAILDDIMAGKYADSTDISNKLDEAANALDAAGLMEQYDAKLNGAADYLTEAMAKEAAAL